MKTVNIHKSFFEINSPASKGLISGLKKLTDKNFVIISEDSEILPELKKIFALEGIKVQKNYIGETEKNLIISTKKSKNKNTITVSPKGKIKNFEEAVNEILNQLRRASRKRKTKETEIKIEVSLDGRGTADIKTGVGFFDHMLEQIARHSNINLYVKAKGDLHIDEHHTVEDVGITLGEAIADALGDKKGIKRYGFFLPMDDAVAECAIDLSGRTYLNFKCKFERESVGKFPTELTEEFFRGLASGLKANIFIRAKGKNDHHKIESVFKAFAKALNEACRIDERNEGVLPSTKGLL